MIEGHEGIAGRIQIGGWLQVGRGSVRELDEGSGALFPPIVTGEDRLTQGRACRTQAEEILRPLDATLAAPSSERKRLMTKTAAFTRSCIFNCWPSQQDWVYQGTYCGGAICND
jgi:hypothetical protein